MIMFGYKNIKIKFHFVLLLSFKKVPTGIFKMKHMSWVIFLVGSAVRSSKNFKMPATGEGQGTCAEKDI